MTWTFVDGWIVVAGVLSAMSCALVGNYLVLRKMSMMGDAISHAVLVGLAAAFIVTGSRSGSAMLIGAGVAGVLTAVLTQGVHQLGKVDHSASMGVVFTVMFAVGLILIVRVADKIDLDPGCVFYGSIESIPMYALDGHTIPPPVVRLIIVFVADLLFVVVFYKELKLSSFDPDLATTLGINASLMHYLLMALVAATTVASFESVGSILVIAMLIVPAAAAHLLTDRLGVMIVISLVIAAASAVLGHVAAQTVPGWFGFPATNTSGMMAAVAGLLFAVAMIAAPRHGVAGRLWHRAALTLRILREDALGLLYRHEEMRGNASVTMPAPALRQALVARGPMLNMAMAHLARLGRVERVSGAYRLTPAGRDEARKLVRSHRLWESYLAKHMGLAADHLHVPAERLEHVTDPAMRQQLEAGVEQAAIDPQGKRIPPELPEP